MNEHQFRGNFKGWERYSVVLIQWILLLVTGSILGAGVALGEPEYTLQMYPLSDNPYQINAQGEAVILRSWNTRPISYYPMRLSPSLTATALNTIPSCTTTFTAIALNDSNEVTGSFPNCQLVAVPLYWDSQGMLTSLQPLSSGRSAYGVAINDNGMVVGRAYDQAGLVRAVAWHSDAIDSPPLALSSGYGEALALNNSGLVVGLVRDAPEGSNVPFAYDIESSAMRFLPMPTEFHTAHAIDVNSFGYILGIGSGAQNFTSVIWGPDGIILRLTSDLAPGGAAVLRAKALNDDGVVVGRFRLPVQGDVSLPVDHGFIYRIGDVRARDLNSLVELSSGNTIAEALDVSRTGHILVRLSVAEFGVRYGLLSPHLSPTPTPTALATEPATPTEAPEVTPTARSTPTAGHPTQSPDPVAPEITIPPVPDPEEPFSPPSDPTSGPALSPTQAAPEIPTQVMTAVPTNPDSQPDVSISVRVGKMQRRNATSTCRRTFVTVSGVESASYHLEVFALVESPGGQVAKRHSVKSVLDNQEVTFCLQPKRRFALHLIDPRSSQRLASREAIIP